MKNLNVPIEDERHEDLIFIQKYYTEKQVLNYQRLKLLKIII